ncbi:MAG: TVP38/TMEM64 family protein [Deltaproteobacteria bacterium]|nr:TVP38/TMEM64 family protein [Deltaproteobacteria bacterium]
MANNNNKNWPRLLLRYGLLLIFICLLLYYYREAYQGFRDAVRFFSNRDQLSDFVASFGYFAPLTFIGLQYLQVLFAPIPGELTGFIGGYLFGIGPGLIYSTIGLTIGSLSNFLIARRLGLPFVRRFVGQELMARFDYLMEHQGAFFAFIFFLIPGMPKDYFCYLLGLSPMHIITFFVVSFVGRIPGTLLLALQGQAVRSENYRGFFVVLGIALFLIVLTVVYRDRIERWLKIHRKPKKH